MRVDADGWIGGRAVRRAAGVVAVDSGRGSKLGREAEDIAHRLLLESGYIPVARNVRTRYGEIDVIAKDGRTLVFVEVKARRLADHEDAFEAAADGITPRKQRRLRRLAQWYLLRKGESPDVPIRFDAVLVDVADSGFVRRAHLIRNAF